jgi:ribosomal protein L32
MADQESESELVRCEGCQEMVRPQTASSVSLVAATVVTVHSCPHCGGQKVAVASPFS